VSAISALARSQPALVRHLVLVPLLAPLFPSRQLRAGGRQPCLGSDTKRVDEISGGNGDTGECHGDGMDGELWSEGEVAQAIEAMRRLVALGGASPALLNLLAPGPPLAFLGWASIFLPEAGVVVLLEHGGLAKVVLLTLMFTSLSDSVRVSPLLYGVSPPDGVSP